jgi:hypothetical protein
MSVHSSICIEINFQALQKRMASCHCIATLGGLYRTAAQYFKRTTTMTNALPTTRRDTAGIGALITEILTGTTIALAGFLALLTVAVNV